MKRLGLIGYPVAHSLSPAIHRAAFASQGLNWSYDLIEVRPVGLASMIDRLRTNEWAGANVTLPHKVSVIESLDSLAGSARASGAVNTIVNQEGRLHGYNTDIAGFQRDLRQQGIGLGDRPALLLGAGGAARAAVHALTRKGSEVTVVARTPARAEGWVRGLSTTEGAAIKLRGWDRSAFKDCRSDVLIVNATPVGMWPHGEQCPWPLEVELPAEAEVYDMVYRPPQTRLVRRAREAGLVAHGGLGMLIEQAGLAFQLWTGLPAPMAEMRAAALAELEVA